MVTSKHLIYAAVALGGLLATTGTEATTEGPADATTSVVRANASPMDGEMEVKKGDKMADSKLVGDELVNDRLVAGDSNRLYLIHVETERLRKMSEDEPDWKPSLRLLLRTSDGPMNSEAVKGFHGHMYMANNWRTPALTGTSRVDTLSSENKTRIVVMVSDNGPIYSSTNSGMSWTIFITPGKYEFTLTGGPNEGGLTAAATIHPSPENQIATKPPASNWYAVTSARDGNKLVVTENASQPAPVLSIAHSEAGVVISWPAGFTNFVLQANSDLNTTNWLDITNTANIVSNENQVIVPPEFENNFFRLRSQ